MEPQQIIIDTIKKIKDVQEPILPEQSLANYLGFDSLDMADLAYELEAEFPIHISNTEMERIKTVGDVFKLVEGKLK